MPDHLLGGYRIGKDGYINYVLHTYIHVLVPVEGGYILCHSDTGSN